MSWLLPHSGWVGRERLDVILAENELAREHAEATDEKATASAAANQMAAEATMEETRRRAKERRERARQRAAGDPSLGAVNDVLRLLERRG